MTLKKPDATRSKNHAPHQPDVSKPADADIKQNAVLTRRNALHLATGGLGGLMLPGALSAQQPVSFGSFADGKSSDFRKGADGQVGRYRDELVKDLTNLNDLSYKSQSAQWWKLTNFITPVDRFFIRNAHTTPRAELDPRVDPRYWKLKIHGDGVERELTITYDDLMRMPSQSVTCTLECAGNSRNMYGVHGKKVKGNAWGLGAIGQAEWQYVSMSHILGLVGLKKNAKWALFWSGVDAMKPGVESDQGRPLPVHELITRGRDIGLAFKMNGQDLPPDHGAPVRVIVPGWTGAASIKWLTEIKIASHNFWTPLSAFDHVFEGPDYPVPKPEPGDEFRFCPPDKIKGPMVTWLKPKSLLTLPLVINETESLPSNYPLKLGEKPRLPAGKRTITGFGWGPQYPVKLIEYRIDGGAWQRARATSPQLGRYTWVRFAFEWDATPGSHMLETRVTDFGGNTQPDDGVAFNSGGYDFWGVPKIPVEIV
jgi:sulfane dehydrogenase subunit SoxC